MTVVADRVVEVRVGPPGGAGRAWTDLYISADVEGTTGSAPNKATIKIYNLSPTSLQWLEQPGQVVQLLAGETVAGQLFQGDLDRRAVTTARNGSNWITTIKAADGRRTLRDTRFVRSYPAGTTRTQVLTDVIAAMSVARGYISPLVERTYQTSEWFAGSASDALDRILAPDRATWSVQSGALQVLAESEAAPGAGVIISPTTGMRGSPERTSKGVTVTHTLTPSIHPGSVVSIQSRHVTGFYKATKVSHSLEKHGPKWDTKIVGVPYR